MFRTNTYLKNISAVLLICLAACSSQSFENGSVTPTLEPMAVNTAAVDHQLPTPNLTSTGTATPDATQDLEPTHTPTVIPSATPTDTSTPEVAQHNSCPRITDNDSPPIWSEGSVLFNTGKMRLGAPSAFLDIEEPGIWAISSNDLSPRLISDDLLGALVSPDGDKLFYVQDRDGSTQEAILYNILTNEIISFEFSPTETLFTGLETWLPDGRIQYETVIERSEGVGETREVFIFDPTTRQVEKLIEELGLPGYTFDAYDIERGIPSGYDAVDPTRQLILYSAKRSDDNGIVVRLLDRRTNQVIWEQISEFIGHTSPEWSVDGNYVLFEVGIPIQGTQYAWSQIVSLTRDGRLEDIPSQPFPGTDKNLISGLSRSPHGRYIFYTVYDFSNQTTHGFIVDMVTQEIGEICDPGAETFVTGFQGSVKVHWIQDNLLIYSVIVEKEGQTAHSLRILDIVNWTTQVVFEANSGYGVNIFGWTPVEFP